MSGAAPAAAVRSEPAPRPIWPSNAHRILVMLVAVAAGSLLSLPGLKTPAPREPTEPSFSAPRATDRAKALLGDGPRPTGSGNNLAAIERMKDWLRARGLNVEVQEASLRAGGRDTVIRNLLARKTGSLPGPAVMLVAHHDTVPGSPGVCDDSMGVAVALEAAAALTGGNWKGRDVVILLTDAEEMGLLGARHFAANHRWMGDIGAVVNVDSRGNAGPSLLYEVGPGSAEVMRVVTPNLGPVVANSLFAEIARHLPQATDFMVFRDHGKPGLNFALIEGHEHYHAPTDTWNNADLGALQHLGDAALTSVFSLGQAAVPKEASTGEAVFLDVGGRVLAWWPERTGIVLSAGCAVTVAACGWLGAKRRRSRSVDVLKAAAIAAGCMVIGTSVTGLAAWLPQVAGAFGPAAETAGQGVPRAAAWPGWGPAWLAACIAAGTLAAAMTAHRFTRRIGGWCMTCGGWFAFATAVSLVALLLPGVTAPLLPVLLLATLGLATCLFVLDETRPLGGLLATAAPAFAAGALLTPIEVLAWSGVGMSMPLFTAARAAVLSLLVMSMASPRAEPS